MSASPESVRKAFEDSRPLVGSVRSYVGSTLRSFCDGEFLFADRVKTLGSVSEKLESGRFGHWSDLDDLYACTIVVPVATFESKVLNFLRSAFSEVRSRGRTDTRKAPDTFRFDGLRWYGKVTPEAAEKMPIGASLLVFEVQILTAFEYAWSRVTHSLVYKSDDVDWKRQRLAAQLKAAVEQIEMIIASFDASSSAVQESPWPENELKQKIISKFQQWVLDKKIPDSIAPDSWSRFADNVHGLLRQVEREEGRRADALSSLLECIEGELQNESEIHVPVSGTLFQYVLGVLSRTGSLKKIKKGYFVPSVELRDLHGILDLPREFQFDTISANEEALKESMPE
ncbi:hypothetical protein [Kutzneria chonburiensis]|uniref:RelA/SpoT domain-containing protein n=1 Tax=Kutzneria chonburiensis TaxID=1483604 RepID=A0ABV6MV57_9PSEU|nr:hypothetical protein [Kutzneria chonburiensis]